MKKFFLPFLVTMVFLFESVFVELFSEKWFQSYLFVPRFLLVVLVFVTIFVGQTDGMMYGFLFGFLYDIVYTEILGVYAFIFTIVAYLTAKAMKIFHTNSFTASFLALTAIVFVEFYVYGIQLIVGGTTMTFSAFLNDRLFPTVFVHTILVLLFAYPLKQKLLQWTAYRREN
ncbi:rod shape-determining protein MreD [Thermolongibacillus altinsuensis]|jgi:rod shape-determining protein MreD|uniref:Rod shape-determining protein MreD n=1 Tax=Thermolongibacillus altinsuensis TaxID=575256 RepID=A0A4R1QHD6_9BACL|nr:rod shape-determining protein MreD [Thermolongibacillus altinsuensis]TCL51940.1 rod shape-determining protein MreD [Thermolongibacillus altinsuensis]GMB07475.1 rod shape-determining protein MreD [Thermolongibacillus altinsuensis]